jgi:hypothetical protein
MFRALRPVDHGRVGKCDLGQFRSPTVRHPNTLLTSGSQSDVGQWIEVLFEPLRRSCLV